MCDDSLAQHLNGSDSGIISPADAAAACADQSYDALSITSESSGLLLDHQQQLHQTTQSLFMASSMMAGLASVGGHYNAAPGLFGSTESMNEAAAMCVTPTHNRGGHTPPQAFNTVRINIAELLRENQLLRAQLKEIAADRDRLLCEASNLRLELDMSELKRLPEGSFPQKAIERSGSTQYGIAAPPPGSNSSGSSLSADNVGGGGGGVGGGGGGGYVYLQQHYVPAAAVSSNSSNTINYPVGPPHQPHMIYQHHPQQYPTCHQQQLIHQSQQNISATGGMHYGQHVNAHQHHQHQQQQQQHHHLLHGHHHHHGGAVVIAGSGVGTGIGMSGGNGSGCTSPASSAMQQNLHKKNSIRNGGEVMKRARAQTAYELSQDLLEKQIELLERKYGGVRARNAAIIVQRAFRHYMMVKKFASITAMAKAEKRLSRRMMVANVTGGDDGPASNSSLSSAYGSATESQLDVTQTQPPHHSNQPRVTIMAGGGGPPGTAGSSPAASSRTPPTRSLSMRERRQQDGSPIPRSQSGASTVSATSSSASSSTLGSSGGAASAHPHVNLLHAAEPHYYSSAGHHISCAQASQYYTAAGYHVLPPHDASYASSANSSSHLDSSLNVSWVSGTSPHSPYYSAQQIYMRPKNIVVQSPADRKKVPPEVPKRTSSITQQQQHAQHLAAQQAAAAQHLLMMRQTPPPPSMMRSNGLCKTSENGSLTSVQSSGSDSSVTSVERIVAAAAAAAGGNISDLGSDRSNSPHTTSWKRGTTLNSSQQFAQIAASVDVAAYAAHAAAHNAAAAVAVVGVQAVSGVGGGISDDHAVSSHTSAAQYGEPQPQQDHQQLLVGGGGVGVSATTTQNYKVSETIRKRQYRVGLNLFNKKPEKGITYLIRRGFLENTPQGVARFLISRKGLSRQMIGEYLGNLQNQFNMAVLNCFSLELDLSGMQVDVALRKFQTYFRMPGEAQKIERLMEIFSHRYCQCNQEIVARLRSSDTIFVLAFAIIMLNTDLHTPNLKPERRMRVEDFVKNLRGIDDCHDIEKDMLGGIYDRVKANEFKPGSDHVTQVMKVQATIVGKKPNLALPHRRLVCYCRLYEIPDVNKKERPGVHQREVFLFNDLLVITKIFSKKKSSVTYTFRNSFPLCGMVVTLLDVANYPFCIQLSQKVDGKILITFNARNEHDRCKFAEDLKESISEMDEMEALRIEAELERQKSARNRTGGGGGGGGGSSSSAENRDSGVADVEVCPCPYQSGGGSGGGGGGQSGAGSGNGGGQDHLSTGSAGGGGGDASSQQLKRSALSNSLLDMHEQFGNDKPQRRGSVGSLDSGMSISFQSTTTSSASRENAAVIAAAANAAAAKMRFNLPPPTSSTAAAGLPPGAVVYTAPPPGYVAANYAHQTHALMMQQQQQQQQQQLQHQQQQQLAAQNTHVHVVVAAAAQPPVPTTGRIPGRERKPSRSDESGRSTEV